MRPKGLSRLEVIPKRSQLGGSYTNNGQGSNTTQTLIFLRYQFSTTLFILDVEPTGQSKHTLHY